MLKKILLALIFVITAITNVTYAEDDMKTAASKAYVDTKIETKQLKIPAANTPGVGAGETVMTYTSTGNGQIGERGLYSDISSYDATTDADKLITASALNATFTNLPTTGTTKLECANQADGCTLWTIVDQTAYGNELPSGYTRLEYIQSNGGQYIDTGKTYNSNYKYELTYQRTQNTSTPFAGYRVGSSASSGQNVSFTYTSEKDAMYYADTATSSISTSFYARDTNKHTIILDASNSICSADGVNYWRSVFLTTEIVSSQNFYLFTDNRPTLVTGMTGRFYSYKVTDGNQVIQNLVPCKRNDDNVLGMCDTVSGQFFTNAATSGPDFTAGPPVN